MDTIINALRSILGEADFYKVLSGYNNATWDYGAIIEYIVGALVLLVCISSVFRFLMLLVKGKR